MSRTDLVVSGWSAVSPYGLGAEPFAAGLLAGDRTVEQLDPQVWPVPDDRAALVPDFDIPTVLGTRGTRSMDRITGLAVSTVGLLFTEYGPKLADRPEDVGLVLGTGSGSVQSIMDFTRDSLTGEKPFHVDPARFPNTVMNCAAGQSAIRHQLKGPNTTVAGGALTGLLALNYAGRLHRRGRSEVILCGAVEEYSVQRSWLEWHANDGAAPTLGEGCAVLLLESGASAERYDRQPLATVLGAGFGAFPDRSPDRAREVLAGCVRRVLADNGATGPQVRLVAPAVPPGPLGDAERAALADVLADDTVVRIECRDLLGDTAAASASFQLTALLAAAGARPDLAGTLALATSVDQEGTVGCALLRIGSAAPVNEGIRP
ncbi:beta-ketoacyl synthase N-terminal-like domain-containing protein [Plantactinospora sp. B5E13]|uniref:beta-ketoacyl synthase N-terminal-like domain-containing protein n=1 Tax=unclassified Plantactinospora TaxID=2631981 RepID=UPI00325DB0FF